MKIINKSGVAGPLTNEEAFYVLLAKGYDIWEGPDFHFHEGEKFSSEEEAISLAEPGDAVAKVTLVAKIV